MRNVSSEPWSFRISDAAYREEKRLLRENEKLRRALEMICAPVPFEAMADSTIRSMGALFGQRMQIAQRALRGAPLEVAPVLDTSVKGQEQGSGAPQPAEESAPTPQGMEGPH